MNIKKKKVLMEAFFMAQFSYCPLTWMFHSRKLNNKISKLHERCLRIVYGDNTSSFEKLLETDNSLSVHHRNIQVLETELCKIVNGLSPEIMKEVFPFSENGKTFHLAPKIWELVPVEIKNVESVASFKGAIKKIETNKLSLSTMPDVCFSGWFRVIYFMIRHKSVFLCFVFCFFFCFYYTIFFVILDS